jgi:hypothetical protein
MALKANIMNLNSVKIIIILLSSILTFNSCINAKKHVTAGQPMQINNNLACTPKDAKQHAYLYVTDFFYDSINVANEAEMLSINFNPLSAGRDTIYFAKRLLKEFAMPEICQYEDIESKLLLKVSKDSDNKFQNIEVLKGKICIPEITLKLKKILIANPLLMQDKKFSHFYMQLRFEYR